MNELLLASISIASLAFVVIAWQLGKERLYSAIIVFLILIVATGGKTVEFFGHETNTGNIFYAGIFLATYFLIERFGKSEGLRSIWIGIFGISSFALLLWLTILLKGSGSTTQFDSALTDAFTTVPRVGLASIVAYSISQTLNVHLYSYLKTHYEGVHLWLRANFTNICAQCVDTAIFFSIAFFHVVPTANVLNSILTGLSLKILFMIFAAPFLTMNRIEEDDSGFFFLRVR